MAWSFDVASNIPRLNQSGTEVGLAGIATAITNQPAVLRSTAYTTASIPKPPTPNGCWYKCTTAGTTAATAPTYNPVLGSTTIDGTAVFTAIQAPLVQTLGTTNHYYMPDVRMQINGTLTNANPQQQNFTCYDLIIYTGNFTSGAWASDGVTPLWDGLHFAAVRTSASGADGVAMSLRAGGQFTFIGGEVQVANGVTFDNATTPRSYLTRWRNTKEYGASSARFRSYTTNLIFQNVETYDFAYDLFRMPTVAPSIKARGSEYVYQYVGAGAGGADAKFVASNLENPGGTYDFDNYFGGWVELYNCAKGASLSVVSQYPNSSIWVKHCVPLYQDVTITAKDTAGAVVQDVRFTATESPTNSPTVTFTTASALKTWDFRTPLSYQTTTNASGIATTSPVLNVWYWQTSFKQSLRFPSSTATYEGRAYNYKTMTVSALLGSSVAVPVSAGMIGLDTPTTITETAALALTGITLTPSGATGGSIVISSNQTLQDIWNYYRAWISAFANRSSNDTWTAIGGKLSTGAWNITVNTGVTLSGDSNINTIATTGSFTNNGTVTVVYQSSAGISTTINIAPVEAGSSVIIFDTSSKATKLFEQNATAGTKTLYLPPLASATYRARVRSYLYQDFFEDIAIGGGGEVTIVPKYAEDVGVVNTSQSAVSAYTTIDDHDEFRDRAKVYGLTEAGMKLNELAVRNGTSIDILAGYSGEVDENATVAFNVTGNLITIKTSEFRNGTRFINANWVPPATFTAKATEVIFADFADANGDSSITIQGGSGSFALYRFNITSTAYPTAGTDERIASGNLVEALVGNGKYRFTASPNFNYAVQDLTQKNIANVPKENTVALTFNQMAVGNYNAGLYQGSELAPFSLQQNEILEIVSDMLVLKNELTGIKGTGFIKDTHSLTNVIADIAGVKADTDSIPSDVWTNTERTLTSSSAGGGATLAEIEASTILAKEASVTAIPANVRTELSTELGRIDATISSRSTLTALDIPEGLTADEVWAYTNRTITSGGITLAEIEASTVLAKEATVTGGAKASDVTDAVTNIKGASNKDITQVFDKESATIAQIEGTVLNSNIVKVNGITVKGNGTPTAPWNPV